MAYWKIIVGVYAVLKALIGIERVFVKQKEVFVIDGKIQITKSQNGYLVLAEVKKEQSANLIAALTNTLIAPQDSTPPPAPVQKEAMFTFESMKSLLEWIAKEYG